MELEEKLLKKKNSLEREVKGNFCWLISNRGLEILQKKGGLDMKEVEKKIAGKIEACFENRKSTEVMENAKFEPGRKKYYFQNFSNI